MKMKALSLGLIPPAIAVALAVGLASCADDSSGLGGNSSGNTTGNSSGGTTGGTTTGGDPGTCVLSCTPTPPPPPTGLDDCNPNNPNARYAPVANVTAVDVISNGICVDCMVGSPVSAFDGNLNTFAIEQASAGLLNGSILLRGYGTTNYQSSPSVARLAGVFISYPTSGSADAQLLSNTVAYTVNGTGAPLDGPGPSTSPNAISLLGIPVVGGPSLAFVGVATQQVFNGVRLDFSPLIGVLGNINVIEACVSK